MKVCFSTWCTDNFTERAGLKKLQNSLKHFHPDIPHYVYNTEDVERAKQKYHDFPDLLQCMIPVQPIEKELIYKYDIVIHIDADSTVTGSLDDFFKGDYHIAGVRNNSDHETAGCHPAITINDPYTTNKQIPWKNFCNAGLVASTIPKFWEDWFSVNKKFSKNHSGHEQDILNCIMNSGRYHVKIMDPIGCGVSYGVNNAWGPLTSRESGVIRHWDSWKGAYIKENKLYIPNIHGEPVEIRVLHCAGGCSAPNKKQDYSQYGFSADVLSYIDNITTTK